MPPIAAALLILLAFGLVLQLRRLILPVRIIAVLAIALGLIKFGQLTLGWPAPFQRLLSGDPFFGPVGASGGRIAASSALAFVLLGAALLAGTARRRVLVLGSQVLGFLAAAIALFVLIGYTLDLVSPLGTQGPSSMPLNSALAIMALAVGIIGLRPDVGLMRILTDSGPAGLLARIALPLAVLAPMLFGLARTVGERLDLYGTEAGVALQVFSSVVVTFTLLTTCIFALYLSDRVRRQREFALAQSEGLYRHAEQVGHIGHWEIEYPDGQVHWSQEFYAICGLSEGVEPSLEASFAVYHPDDAVVAQETVSRAMATCRGWEIAHRIRRPDGEVRHIQSHGVCKRDADGVVRAIFGVFVDVTELESARREAEAATASKAAFLANMSHEIRTPMNGVMGFVELLVDSDLDASQRRHLTLIQESAQALLKLLNDILDLSKIEAGQLEVNPEPSCVNRDISQCVELMTPIAEQKGLALTAEFAPGFPAAVLVDSLRLRQILFNLVGNAVKFTNHGSISVTLGESIDNDGERVMVIGVADTGVGIAEERKAAIFDAFVQADVSISRRFGGSGLGLSISRRLARLMGGMITLESWEGMGTTVTLELPLVEVVAPGLDGKGTLLRAEPSKSAGDGPSRPARILLVEDIDINQELITKMLARLGHKVEVASNGAVALECARRLLSEPDSWDLILMDVQMPVMDGLTATRAIRALGGRAAAIPIIALTANAFASEVQECRDAGMNDHIAKPSRLAQLKVAIERWSGAESSNRADDVCEDRKSTLAERFTARRLLSGERLIALISELRTADSEGVTRLLAEAASIAHVLSGTAGMFGQADLGDLAQQVEDEIKAILGVDRERALLLAVPPILMLVTALGAVSEPGGAAEPRAA
jgi:PAS domain S-box-containing protein